MTAIQVLIVDVYVLRQTPGALQVLCLRRAPGTRCAGTWETVHGHIQAGEKPVDAALRELKEETGLAAERLYNVSRVEAFYLHKSDTVALIPVFAALVPARSEVTWSDEHDAAEWLQLGAAAGRMAWPREGRALADIAVLFGAGDAGGMEDVLRIR